jgi:hypothetical protein
MAANEAIVRVELTGMEPFKSFVGKVARADALFRSMSVEEAKGLPASVCEGIMLLQGAMREIAPDPAPVEGEPESST